MALMNVCLECGNQLTASLRCRCDWIISLNRDDRNIDYQCYQWIANKRCDEAGIIRHMNDLHKWYCAKHWYQADSSINLFIEDVL